MNCILDTNMLIYYLNQSLPEQAKAKFESAVASKANISVITKLEVLGWYNSTEDKYQQSQNLLKKLEEIPLKEEVIIYCVDIRRNHKIKLPDAIIAATALALKIPLVTRNIKDFEKIQNLQLINLFESVLIHN